MWLAGKEQAGLTGLARLVAAGDTTAQLALGLIDAETLYQGPWVQSLDRAARIALMRRPGGLSGKSWLLDLPLSPAPLWRMAWDGGATSQLIPAFLAAGEDRGALVVAPAWLAVLVQRDRANADGKDAVASTSPDPAVTHFLGGPLPKTDALAAWLQTDGLAAPARSYCQTRCPQIRADLCHATIFDAVAGFAGLARVRAPSPALIDEPRFATSPVAHQMLETLAIDHKAKTRRNASDGPICGP
jgi:hypothetical protein